MYCNKCGNILGEGMIFCNGCGNKVENEPSSQNNDATVNLEEMANNSNMVNSPVNNFNTVNPTMMNSQNMINPNGLDKSVNDKYAIGSMTGMIIACVLSTFLKVGLLWVILIPAIVYPIIKKGANSNKPKQAKIAMILLFVFIILQVIQNIAYFMSLGGF